MCTLLKSSAESSQLFFETQPDDSTAFGFGFNKSIEMQCTKNKQLDGADVAPYTVSIPPVEVLALRTACCCQYCGCNCDPKYNPIGCAQEIAQCCVVGSGGCAIATGDLKKRGCRLADCLAKVLACEETNAINPNEFICSEFSSTGMCCCCFVGGNKTKVSFCPAPFTCCSETFQCCCCYGRCSFPCNDFVPMEIGLCGVMCIDKKETIAKAEEDYRQKTAESSGVVEAVIVQKGAPSLAMDR
jgi:hypothetical protein